MGKRPRVGLNLLGEADRGGYFCKALASPGSVTPLCCQVCHCCHRCCLCSCARAPGVARASPGTQRGALTSSLLPGSGIPAFPDTAAPEGPPGVQTPCSPLMEEHLVWQRLKDFFPWNIWGFGTAHTATCPKLPRCAPVG